MGNKRRERSRVEAAPVEAEAPRPNRKPNEVPLLARIFLFGVSIVLLAHGASGFFNNKLEFGVGKGRGTPLVFHDGAAWLLASALIVGGVLLLSVLVEHHDKRHSEAWYRRFRLRGLCICLCCGASAFAAYLLIFFGQRGHAL